MEPYFLGIDVGTTHVKSLSISESGQVLSQQKLACKTISGLPAGYHEQNPIDIFNAVIKLISAARQIHGLDIRAVTLSAAMHSYLALSADGSFLTNLITWADTRSHHQAHAVKNSDAGNSLYIETGTPLHPMTPFCKALWFKENQLELFRKTARIADLKSYLLFKLTGQWVTDHGIASASGLFNFKTRSWSEHALKETGISKDKLPEPVPVSTRLRFLPEIADKLKLTNETVIVAGSSDGALANLGLRALNPGDRVISTGTSGAIRTTTRQPVENFNAQVFNYILDDDFLISGGATNNAGNVIRWAQSVFKISDYSERADHQPGPEGLYFLPYLFGERAPVWDSRAKGAFTGINETHQADHMLKATMEGVCYNLLQINNLTISNKGNFNHRYFVSGGLTQSQVFINILANIFGKDLLVRNEGIDASAMGAIMVGMMSTGFVEHYEALPIKEMEFQQISFTPAKHNIYKTRFKKFTKLYPLLSSL